MVGEPLGDEGTEAALDGDVALGHQVDRALLVDTQAVLAERGQRMRPASSMTSMAVAR